MGWYATHQALVIGQGAYGNVKESLEGEKDGEATLCFAINKIDRAIRGGTLKLDRAARARVGYWRRVAGFPKPRHVLKASGHPVKLNWR